ncbi:hypothetical protein, partial [uncultured Cardiobacterium sp.]|uniref:hypothetical protein n=1 Tax=uncultured Cardiobacterium sp. TaxID=417619 RepID=UPI0026100433
GVGVSDIVHELKFLFFNGFVVLIPNLSLLRKQCLSLRELSQPLKERGIYRRFYLLPFAQENGFSQTLNRF